VIVNVNDKICLHVSFLKFSTGTGVLAYDDL
jgi:hypothetical protein